MIPTAITDDVRSMRPSGIIPMIEAMVLNMLSDKSTRIMRNSLRKDIAPSGIMRMVRTFNIFTNEPRIMKFIFFFIFAAALIFEE